MSSFLEYMTAKQKMALSEAGDGCPPEVRRARLERNMKNHEWRKRRDKAVQAYAKANSTDPSAAARAWSHIMSGLADPDDYSDKRRP